jgi:cell division protein FtsB
MPPRRTKADLEDSNDFLRREVRNLSAQLEDARRALKERRERDRSPRRLSASTSHDRLSSTCNALLQVRRWERDVMLDERDAKIAELQATVEKQKEEIASLRRGEGSIGEVLLANWAVSEFRRRHKRI